MKRILRISFDLTLAGVLALVLAFSITLFSGGKLNVKDLSIANIPSELSQTLSGLFRSPALETSDLTLKTSDKNRTARILGEETDSENANSGSTPNSNSNSGSAPIIQYISEKPLKIGYHVIEAENIDGGSITSRTIKNQTIRSQDLARILTIQHLTIDHDLTAHAIYGVATADIATAEINTLTGVATADISTATINTLTATSIYGVANATLANAQIQTLDLGTNTITDGNMNGNWDFGSGNLTTTGTLTVGAVGTSGDLDLNTHIIKNIGNSGTDFTALGGLNLAGNLNVNNLFYVDTASGNVGIGTTSPQAPLYVSGDIFGLSGATSQRAQKDVLDPGGFTRLSATLPYAAGYGCSMIIGDYIYLFGGAGYGWSGNNAKYVQRAPLSNPTSWENLGAKLPWQVGWSSSAIINDYIYSERVK